MWIFVLIIVAAAILFYVVIIKTVCDAWEQCKGLIDLINEVINEVLEKLNIR